MRPKHSKLSPAKEEGTSEVLHPMEWASQAGVADEVLQGMNRRLKQRRNRRLASIASAMVISLLVTLIWVRPSSPHPEKTNLAMRGPVATHAALVEILPDDSHVELRLGARIRVEFTANLRRVVLEEGEAYFAVTKDSQRPFVVEAGAIEARAVGTAFTVELKKGGAEVVVAEGKVAVQKTSNSTLVSVTQSHVNPEGLMALLSAGHQVMVEDIEQMPVVKQLSAGELSQRLAWRVQMLELSGTRLDEAIEHFNRHGKRHLVLGDPDIGRVQLSGIIRADNIEMLLRLLKEDHGIVPHLSSSGEWVLRRQP